MKVAVMVFRTLVEPYVVMNANRSSGLIPKIVDADVTFQFSGFWNCDMFVAVQVSKRTVHAAVGEARRWWSIGQPYLILSTKAGTTELRPLHVGL